MAPDGNGADGNGADGNGADGYGGEDTGALTGRAWLAALPDALGMLRGPIRRRVRAAAGSGRKKLVYLEDGRPVAGIS